MDNNNKSNVSIKNNKTQKHRFDFSKRCFCNEYQSITLTAKPPLKSKCSFNTYLARICEKDRFFTSQFLVVNPSVLQKLIRILFQKVVFPIERAYPLTARLYQQGKRETCGLTAISSV